MTSVAEPTYRTLRIELPDRPVVLVPAWIAAVWLYRDSMGAVVWVQPAMGPQFQVAHFPGVSPEAQRWAVEQADALVARITAAIEAA